MVETRQFSVRARVALRVLLLGVTSLWPAAGLAQGGSAKGTVSPKGSGSAGRAAPAPTAGSLQSTPWTGTSLAAVVAKFGNPDRLEPASKVAECNWTGRVSSVALTYRSQKKRWCFGEDARVIRVFELRK